MYAMLQLRLMKKPKLTELFKPAEYKFSINPDNTATLVIIGSKINRPNKRITLHQKGLKVLEALITRTDKKGARDLEVVRINHLPTFEQVRLHTNETLYPGHYEIKIKYRLPFSFDSIKPSRTYLPCVDEPEAWANAKLEIK